MIWATRWRVTPSTAPISESVTPASCACLTDSRKSCRARTRSPSARSSFAAFRCTSRAATAGGPFGGLRAFQGQSWGQNPLTHGALRAQEPGDHNGGNKRLRPFVLLRAPRQTDFASRRSRVRLPHAPSKRIPANRYSCTPRRLLHGAAVTPGRRLNARGGVRVQLHPGCLLRVADEVGVVHLEHPDGGAHVAAELVEGDPGGKRVGRE